MEEDASGGWLPLLRDGVGDEAEGCDAVIA